MFFRSLSLVIVLSSISQVTGAEEWTRFRGPNGSGVSDAKTIPVKWSESDIRWQTQLPGEGISSPVIWGERVFVTSAEPDLGKRHLMCLHTADGRELWRQTEPFDRYKKHTVNTFATSTPAVDEQRVYQ